jgi:hypothetical protein
MDHYNNISESILPLIFMYIHWLINFFLHNNHSDVMFLIKSYLKLRVGKFICIDTPKLVSYNTCPINWFNPSTISYSMNRSQTAQDNSA